MSKPSILFHRGTAWRGAVRGSTNVLAAHFAAAGYPVTWLSRPFHVGHLLRGRTGGARSQAVRHDDGVVEIAPFTPVPILKPRGMGRAWPLIARAGYASAGPSLRRILRELNQPAPDIIWSTGGDIDALRGAFPGARRILQCVDIYSAYAGDEIVTLERADHRAADATVTIGHSLADYLAGDLGVPREKITIIGQGADLPLFAGDGPEPAELAGAAHPRLVWVGVLDKADPGMMEAALSALDGGGSLVLIGPPAPWATAFAARDRRVKLLGPRLAEEAAHILKHCDIGLMLYDRARDPRQYRGQNPLKLYEMAAAGLPILSTPHDEYAYSRPPAIVVRDEAETARGVAAAITDQESLGQASLKFAAENGWDRRFQEAEALVQRLPRRES